MLESYLAYLEAHWPEWIDADPPSWSFPTFTPKPYDWQRENRRDYANYGPQGKTR